jgi:hypothetical protein
MYHVAISGLRKTTGLRRRSRRGEQGLLAQRTTGQGDAFTYRID